MELICTKSMSYNTRRLLPGDVFTARPQDAKLLIAIRKAEARVMRAEVAPAPKGIVKVDLSDLRGHAESLGIVVDKRWGEKRLRFEIAKHE